MIDTLNELDALIVSESQFIYIDSLEERRLLDHFHDLAKEGTMAVSTWTAAQGLCDLRTGTTQWLTTELADALRVIKQQQSGVYVLFDVKSFLAQAVIERLLKEIAYDPLHPTRTVILLGYGLELPNELKHMAVNFIPSLPDPDVVHEIYYEEVYRWLSQKRGRKFFKPGPMEDKLMKSLAGLSEEDVRRALIMAIRDDGRITDADLLRIEAFKKENIGKQGLIDFIADPGDFASVAGLDHLKSWLKLRKKTFLGEDAGLSIDPPKGILLLGVQGSGKSLAAKSVAGSWQLPLIHLDFASLYNKWVGESEHNLTEALRQAESLAPCVVWIDEIEKGIINDTASDSDGGLSHRILGTLLTWMSERKSRVFLVATANDVTRLPPELLRKGRFDEIFFVDLPSHRARKEIFTIHLAKRNLKPDHFRVDDLAAASEGFSGAEIEQAIIGGMYIALGQQETPTTEHVMQEIAGTRPLSIVMGEKIAHLRHWAENRTVPAD